MTQQNPPVTPNPPLSCHVCAEKAVRINRLCGKPMCHAHHREMCVAISMQFSTGVCDVCGEQGVVCVVQGKALCRRHEPKESSDRRYQNASQGIIDELASYILMPGESISVLLAIVSDLAIRYGENIENVLQVLQQVHANQREQASRQAAWAAGFRQAIQTDATELDPSSESYKQEVLPLVASFGESIKAVAVHGFATAKKMNMTPEQSQEALLPGVAERIYTESEYRRELEADYNRQQAQK